MMAMLREQIKQAATIQNARNRLNVLTPMESL
jgi:peptide subunit release factor 1 (eRF1)